MDPPTVHSGNVDLNNEQAEYIPVLESLIMKQSSEIHELTCQIQQLQQQVGRYEALYGRLPDEEEEDDDETQEEVKQPDTNTESEPKQDDEKHFAVVEESKPSLSRQGSSNSQTTEEVQLAERVAAYRWVCPPKRSSSLKQITIRNKTGLTLYATIYNKLRIGIGKHERVSPVFILDKNAPLVAFDKPSARTSRSHWLLFCKNVLLYDDEPIMDEMKFQTFPKFCVDFSNDVVISIDHDESLLALNHSAWLKNVQARQRIAATQSPSLSFIRRDSRKKVDIPNPRNYGINDGDGIELMPDLEHARVRSSASLCQDENEFLQKRREITKAGLETFLGESLENRYVPTIAYCSSGGGCRSMVSTLGTLIAAEMTKLMDCFTYVAGVSGSTWTLALWIALGISPLELRDNIIHKFAANVISRPTSKGASELIKLVRSKWVSLDNLDISLIDIYGAQLSTGLLGDLNPAGCLYKISHQAANIASGKFPMPIYTAVQSRVDKLYDWYEFTPYEVGNLTLQKYVPTTAFGRAYLNGVATNTQEEPSLGILLATFGSAFCAPLHRVTEDLYTRLANANAVITEAEQTAEAAVEQMAHSISDTIHSLEPGIEMKQFDEYDEPPAYDSTDSQSTNQLANNSSYLSKAILNYRNSIDGFIDKMSLNHSTIAAGSKFNNFLYQPSVEGSKQRNKILELFDAGIDFNLPFPPLLRVDRKIDIIIATENSKSPDINCGRALRHAAEWAQRSGYKFPPIDFDHTFDNHISVYRDENDLECPVVIYLPLKQNTVFSQFDPHENQLNGGYCSTFNFNLNRDQIMELSSLSQVNLLHSIDTIKDTILEVIDAKTHAANSS